MGDKHNGWDGDLFLVNGKVWADTSRGTPVRIGRVPDLFATDPALPATTAAERKTKARAAVEAAADAEIDALLAARGWRYMVCETCGGRARVHILDGQPWHTTLCPEGCDLATTPCPDCTNGVRRVRT